MFLNPPEIGEITQEKAQEYMAVAGILALDIELLEDMIKDSKDVKRTVEYFIKRSKEVINDKKIRDMRWQGFRMVNWMTQGTVPDNGQKAPETGNQNETQQEKEEQAPESEDQN